MRQASRRSWRIGQRAPVEVTFLVYEGTLQAEALALVAAKMRSALMIEGELSADGLAAIEADGSDLFLALARRFAEQSPGVGQSLEALFAAMRENEVEADGYLVAGDGKAAAASANTGAPAAGWPELRGQGKTGEESVSGSLDPGADAVTGTVTRFGEFAHFVLRTKPRRKAVPEGQLSLFDA
jgi:hypothetical protein